MNDDELIALATECGLMPWVKHEHVGGTSFSATDEGIDGDLAGLIQFAKLVAAHEREGIAEMFDEPMRLVPFVQNTQGGCLVCGFTPSLAAAAIRARSKE